MTLNLEMAYWGQSVLLSCLIEIRLAPVLKTIFRQCVISYTCSHSNSDGSVSTLCDFLRIRPEALDIYCAAGLTLAQNLL